MGIEHGRQLALEAGHVGLNVSDLERSKRFYREVFGFELKGESHADDRRFAFLGTTDRLLLTLWQQSSGRFARERPGLHHLSFQVASVDVVREAERRLRELGVRFQYDGLVPHAEDVTSGGVFFEDPDGIRLEIYCPDGITGEVPVPGVPSCGFF